MQILQASLSPTSLHPHLHLTLTATTECPILLSLTLPDHLFLDRNQLPNLWGPESSSFSIPSAFARPPSFLTEEDDDTLTTSITTGSVRRWQVFPEVIDIERPVLVGRSLRDSKETADFSQLRIELTSPCKILENEGEGEVTLDIPLHARYLQPNENGYENITLFSDGQSGGSLRGGISCSPITEEAFQNLTILRPPTPLSISLPTGHPSHQLFVEFGTALTIWFGWAWIVWKMWKLVKRERAMLIPSRSQSGGFFKSQKTE